MRTFIFQPLTRSACLISRITSSSFRDSDGSVLWQTALFAPDVAGHLSIKPLTPTCSAGCRALHRLPCSESQLSRTITGAVSYATMPNTHELTFPAEHLLKTIYFITFLCGMITLAGLRHRNMHMHWSRMLCTHTKLPTSCHHSIGDSVLCTWVLLCSLRQLANSLLCLIRDSIIALEI